MSIDEQARPSVQWSLYFQAPLMRVWSPIGQTPIVKVHPQREHVHFYGALDARTGCEIALPVSEQSGLITTHFICLLLALFSTQPILLLLDRAPWHFGPELAQLFDENDRLQVIYYPTACPDLNPMNMSGIGCGRRFRTITPIAISNLLWMISSPI